MKCIAARVGVQRGVDRGDVVDRERADGRVARCGSAAPAHVRGEPKYDPRVADWRVNQPARDGRRRPPAADPRRRRAGVRAPGLPRLPRRPTSPTRRASRTGSSTTTSARRRRSSTRSSPSGGTSCCRSSATTDAEDWPARDKLRAIAAFILDSYRHDPDLMKVIVVEVTRAANSFGLTHAEPYPRGVRPAWETSSRRPRRRRRSAPTCRPRFAALAFYGVIEQVLTGWIFDPASDAGSRRSRRPRISSSRRSWTASPHPHRPGPSDWIRRVTDNDLVKRLVWSAPARRHRGARVDPDHARRRAGLPARLRGRPARMSGDADSGAGAPAPQPAVAAAIPVPEPTPVVTRLGRDPRAPSRHGGPRGRHRDRPGRQAGDRRRRRVRGRASCWRSSSSKIAN